jgi:hypothetical protein
MLTTLGRDAINTQSTQSEKGRETKTKEPAKKTEG